MIETHNQQQLRTDAAKARLEAIEENIEMKGRSLKEAKAAFGLTASAYATEIEKVMTTINDQKKKAKEEYNALVQCEGKLNYLGNQGFEDIDDIVQGVIGELLRGSVE